AAWPSPIRTHTPPPEVIALDQDVSLRERARARRRPEEEVTPVPVPPESHRQDTPQRKICEQNHIVLEAPRPVVRHRPAGSDSLWRRGHLESTGAGRIHRGRGPGRGSDDPSG